MVSSHFSSPCLDPLQLAPESSRFAFVGSHFSGLKHFETQTEHIRSIRLDVAGADLL